MGGRGLDSAEPRAGSFRATDARDRGEGADVLVTAAFVCRDEGDLPARLDTGRGAGRGTRGRGSGVFLA